MKKKMNLNALEVQSFVTNFKEGKEETVKGGKPVPLPVTNDFRTCTWYSELGTVCGCETELFFCDLPLV